MVNYNEFDSLEHVLFSSLSNSGFIHVLRGPIKLNQHFLLFRQKCLSVHCIR